MSGPAGVKAAKPEEQRVSKWKLAVASMIACIVLYFGFIAVRWISPARWEFSVEAATEIAEVRFAPDTENRWRIDGAVICARETLDLPDDFRLDPADSPCGSQVWHPWRIPEPEQALNLDGGVTASMELRPEGGFAMSLRTGKDQSLGTLSVVGRIEDVDLGDAVNLLWLEIPEQSVTLPFSGTTTLGRAVNWSGSRMLRSGGVVVYTADESADKRTMVDEAQLMLGDQVSLGEPVPHQPWPKGFVRVFPGEDVMQVVAFGRADSLRIERFGESGYDFKPAPLNKLASDPAIAFWGGLLAAYMTLILSVQPFVRGGEDCPPPARVWQRMKRWFQKTPAR